MFRYPIAYSMLSVACFLFISFVYLAKAPLFTLRTTTPQHLSHSQQIRHGVCKDLWIYDSSHTRLHHKIESKQSIMQLCPRGDSIEVLEQLFDVQCWMQEKLSYQQPVQQQMRFILAKEGFYNYRTQHFQATDVLLSMYRLPYTHLPSTLQGHTPFLRGKASHAFISIKDGIPQFTASQFTASLGDDVL